MALFAVFLCFSFFLLVVTSDFSPEEKKALVLFKEKVKHDESYSWDESKSVCNSESPGDDNWKGVTCHPGDENVRYLKMPSASLIGEIPRETIGKLVSLHVLSLHGNRLNGTLPDDFSNLVNLETLSLTGNNFSGNLPDLKNSLELKNFDVSYNNFSGNLPDLKFLKKFDVSYNNFSGPIPNSLSSFNKSAFAGNNYLCGPPLYPCKNQSPQPTAESQAEKTPAPNRKHKETGVIVGVSVGSGLLLLILLCCLRKRINKQEKQPQDQSSAPRTSTGGETKKFVFVDNAGVIYSFDLDDLYRASPEVLGKGSAGTSYKAVMDESTTVVVKQLEAVVVTKMEFESTMEVLGRMKNENLIPLRAYYYSEHEKLLVYDYLPAGSLSARLHGSKGSNRILLDWGHRMRIALSAARGVAYLHEVGKLVHGNIKSSNVLLQQEDEKNALVSDFGLNTLFHPNRHVRGYVAPEVLKDQTLTFKSDVYNFGILLLELLMGKIPNQAFLCEELPRLVRHNTNIPEEWKAGVFDVELKRHPNVELEMVQLLKIAMECVSTMPNQRPSMHELVRKIKDIKYAEFDDSSVDPSKGSDSHTPSTDSHTPSIDI